MEVPIGENPSDPINHRVVTIPIPSTANDPTTSVSRNGGGGGARRWPTVDGPLGLSEEESIGQAGNFFKFGFCLLPWLWAVNCLYFWPVLSKSPSDSHPKLRYYVVGSAIGFTIFTVFFASWALTFAIGGERVFGDTWNDLVMYNVADRYGLTGWM